MRALLTMRGIVKVFPGLKALHEVEINLRAEGALLGVLICGTILNAPDYVSGCKIKCMV